MLCPRPRIATADSRTPRCESMNVSAALYLAGSSERRRSPTRRIMSRRDPSRWVELDVRVHHLGVLSTKPLAHPCEKPFSVAGRDIVPHRDTREYEELVGAHLYRPQIDDLVDARLGSDRGAEPVEDFLGRSLADAQPAPAPGKRVRDAAQADAAAAKEEKQRDDQRPEVALLPVPEWMALRCRPHASTDADIKKDLIHRVRDRVRRLREERPRPCHESRDRLGDRDRQVAGESRD